MCTVPDDLPIDPDAVLHFLLLPKDIDIREITEDSETDSDATSKTNSDEDGSDDDEDDNDISFTEEFPDPDPFDFFTAEMLA